MAQGLREVRYESVYPHASRMAAMFTAALQGAAGPSLGAKKILDIAEGESWQLRYPVGPDAQGFLDWRASMTDEEWTDRGGMDDETWYAAMERDFGLDFRPKE